MLSSYIEVSKTLQQTKPSTTINHLRSLGLKVFSHCNRDRWWSAFKPLQSQSPHPGKVQKNYKEVLPLLYSALESPDPWTNWYIQSSSIRRVWGANMFVLPLLRHSRLSTHLRAEQSCKRTWLLFFWPCCGLTGTKGWSHRVSWTEYIRDPNR